jgi:hypothetical protein
VSNLFSTNVAVSILVSGNIIQHHVIGRNREHIDKVQYITPHIQGTYYQHQIFTLTAVHIIILILPSPPSPT